MVPRYPHSIIGNINVDRIVIMLRASRDTWQEQAREEGIFEGEE